MPLVSVIVPVYKAELYIGRCIASVQAQDLTDWELILVIDGSPDNSLKVINDYISSDDRIQVINNIENHGPMVARYQGILRARGSYITFLDSDDWLPSSSLRVLYDAAKNTDADIVCGEYTIICDNGKRIPGNANSLPYGTDKIGAFRAVLNKTIHQTLCTKLIKQEALQLNELIVVEHCTNAEDAGLLFQIINRIDKIAVVDDKVYCYYDNSNSSTHILSNRAFESICKNTIIREGVLKNYPELELEKNKYFTNNLFPLMAYDGFKNVLRQYGLQRYVSLNSVMRYISLKTMLRVLVRRIKFTYGH